jgi:hypothetical protein
LDIKSSGFFCCAHGDSRPIPHAQHVVAARYGKVAQACQPEAMRNSHCKTWTRYGLRGHRVPAKARRDEVDGLIGISYSVIASASNPEPQAKLDCFVARAPRNDVDSAMHNSAFSRQHSPEFCKFIGPQKEEQLCRK